MAGQVVRWGLMGTARINRALIPAIRAASRSELVAVASREAARAEAYAREWEIPVAHGSYDALLADPRVNAVYVPLPNHLHAEWSIRAARAGKHVLCEKPLALSAADVDAMAAAARDAGVVLAEAFMYRHHPQTAEVAAMVARGVVGAPRIVRGAFTFTLTRTADVRLRPEWGGGGLWDVGSYPVSYAIMLAGGAPDRVTGAAHPGPTGIDELFVGTLQFPSGLLALFDCGFRAPFRTEIEVIGDEATLVVPHPFKPGEQEELRIVREDRVETIPAPGAPLYVGEIEDFARAVLDGAPPVVPLSESRTIVQTLTALHESAAAGAARVV